MPSMYTIVTSPNGRSFYLAKERIGGGYAVVATFLAEGLAKQTAEILNNNTVFDARKHAQRIKDRT